MLAFDIGEETRDKPLDFPVEHICARETNRAPTASPASVLDLRSVQAEAPAKHLLLCSRAASN
jgi:hypothetical protein